MAVSTDFLTRNSLDITQRNQSTQKSQGATSSDFASVKEADREREPSNELTFEDMLMLMCTQLQNQSIDSTADTNDMMNQLISMTVMQSLTTLTEAVNEVQLASVMAYSASLVGQYVTVGTYDDEGNLQELYGQVEASGTYDGQQVVFIDGKSYFLSSIMAVGKLPPQEETQPPEGSDSTEPDNDNQTDDGTEAGGDNGTEGVRV